MLILRFYRDMTQTQIAERLGISQMHVSRLLTQTLARLRGATKQLTAPRAGYNRSVDDDRDDSAPATRISPGPPRACATPKGTPGRASARSTSGASPGQPGLPRCAPGSRVYEEPRLRIPLHPRFPTGWTSVRRGAGDLRGVRFRARAAGAIGPLDGAVRARQCRRHRTCRAVPLCQIGWTSSPVPC